MVGAAIVMYFFRQENDGKGGLSSILKLEKGLFYHQKNKINKEIQMTCIRFRKNKSVSMSLTPCIAEGQIKTPLAFNTSIHRSVK